MRTKQKVNPIKKGENFWGYVFIAPNLIATVVFVLIPILFSLYMSFMKWDMLNPPEFVGLANFTEKMMRDEQFFIALKNTAIYSLVSIPLGVVSAILVAYVLSGNLPGTTVFRSIIFVPVTLSMISVSMIWKWLLNGDYGVVNYFLSFFGIDGISWLGDERYAMMSVILIGIWKNLGFNVVILIAAFKDVPRALYEAAALDGANGFQKFKNVALPLSAPSIFFVTVMSIINSFQVFDVVYMTTQGGPGDATRVVYYWIYQNAFKFFDMGYASALSWIVFIIIFVFTMLQMKFGGRNQSYD